MMRRSHKLTKALFKTSFGQSMTLQRVCLFATSVLESLIIPIVAITFNNLTSGVSSETFALLFESADCKFLYHA